MLTPVLANAGGVYFSETERALVENRGANFGKIYVYGPGEEEIEAILLWAGRGRISHGTITPTRDQKNRAIRALAESPWGAAALGVSKAPDVSPQPSTLEDALARIAELEAELAARGS